jgi:dienelactone hydrolase
MVHSTSSCNHHTDESTDILIGNAMDPKIVGIMDNLMNPASWIATIFFKPIYLVQTMAIAIPWKMKTGIPATHPKVVSFVQALRTSAPPFATDKLKIGAAGFCWGGKHAILLAHDQPATRVQRHASQIIHEAPQALLDCAFTAHPSYIDVSREIDAITIPLSVAIGDEDAQMKGPQILQMKDILEKKSAADNEVVVMPGAKHGFAVRTHPDDEHEVECAEKAEAQAIKWFTRWLS